MEKPKSPHPLSQSSINKGSNVSTFRCPHGHQFQSGNGVCPTCGMMGTIIQSGGGEFNKALDAPDLNKGGW